MDYRIVIPTYDRPEGLKDKTLAMLQRHNIPLDRVDILLGEPGEADAYLAEIGDIWKGDFIFHYENELGDIVNFIKGYYKYETDVKYLVRFDDDIEEVFDGSGRPVCLDELIVKMFHVTVKNNLNFWGVGSGQNTFFMKDSITTNLKYCCGGFNGEVIDRDKEDIQIEFSQYEDVCMTCEHFIRDGGVVRNNYIGLKHKCWTNGGMASSVGNMETRLALHERDAYEVANKYGDMLEVKQYKWGIGLKLNYRFKL